MKKVLSIAAVAMAIAVSSCNVGGPILTTEVPTGSKTGESSYKTILGMNFSDGDRSIKTAAENGGITRVSTVDYKVESRFFTTRYITIVTGE